MNTTRPRRATSLPSSARQALDANALELLARVAAAGSFAQAARELGQTRAAVSRRIDHIETQIGQPLFVRSTRALGLTDTGRRLASRARAVWEAAEAARHALRARQSSGLDSELSGTLRITSIPSVGQSFLGSALAGFQALHPQLRIELMLTARRVDLQREDIDLALRITREPPLDSVATALLDFAVRAYAAPQRAALPGPQALQAVPCLVLNTPGRSPGEAMALAWQHSGGERQSVSVQPAMVADDLGTLAATARAGGGVVFAPEFCATDDLQRGTLVDTLPGWQMAIPEGLQVQALTLPPPLRPESARALLAYLRDWLARP